MHLASRPPVSEEGREKGRGLLASGGHRQQYLFLASRPLEEMLLPTMSQAKCANLARSSAIRIRALQPFQLALALLLRALQAMALQAMALLLLLFAPSAQDRVSPVSHARARNE